MKRNLTLLLFILLIIPLNAYEVFIVNSNDETLSCYDTSSSSLENHILQLGQYANQIVIRDSIGYVVNSGVHNIQIIDLENISTVGYISCPNGSNPYWMVLHPDQHKAYVTGLFTNTVYSIDLETQEMIGTIPVGSSPEGMVIHDDYCYVMNSSFGSPAGSVSVIDIDCDEVVGIIPVGNNPQFAAVDNMGRLHVVCTGNYGYGSPAVWGKIYIINTENYNDVSIVDIGGSPTKIAIHPNGIAYLADGFGLGFMAYNSHDFSIIHSSSSLWASGGSFIQFDENGTMYLGDSMDWINNGRVYIYSADEELLTTLTVGVNPQDAGFLYPGVSVDAPPQENITACNYPNPFSAFTTISFFRQFADTPWQGNLNKLYRIEIYNLKGQLIKKLTSFPNSCLGMQEVTWNGTDTNDQKVPNGVYLYKIVSGNVETTFHKMIVLR
ncbi:MAG TPA: T9SS type A sorting domain-containing protein [Candidatus Cloacimonetes bacterium]|nr:T9SS type A sorting domain-containing protein [Candidatus Cloacimonadota bacterium]HEX37693.1 T9SS type A sorting domain-containing protein [Candidatus Cloacimonadota bacterium]